jgi:hypothetical protein
MKRKQETDRITTGKAYAGADQQQIIALLCQDWARSQLSGATTHVASIQKGQPLLSTKRRPHVKTTKLSGNRQKYGAGSRRGPNPRMSVLAKASRKLLVYSTDPKVLFHVYKISSFIH